MGKRFLLNYEFVSGISATQNNILNSAKDELHLGDSKGEETASPHTVKREDGGRDIYIGNFNADDRYTVLTSSLVLQHEAYRDGVVTPDNASETAMAAIAHTLMAAKIAKDYG